MKTGKSSILPIFAAVFMGIFSFLFLYVGESMERVFSLSAAEEIAHENPLPGEKEEISAEPETPAPENEADENADNSSFMRLRTNSSGKLIALETSSVPYVSQDGEISVTIIGAVHLGEEAYYKELNEHFKDFEVVLYEVVAEEGTRPAKSGKSSGVIGTVQRQMAAVLQLKFQLEEINYSPENMVHADMTPAEFQEAMENRNENFLKLYLRSVGYSLAAQNLAELKGEVKPIPVHELLFGKNRSLTLKRIMAEEMGNLENSILPIEGKDGSAILTDRNAKVLKILREQLDAGKKNIAIFYGAAHLPDFARNLESEFQLKPGKARWLKAWDLEK